MNFLTFWGGPHARVAHLLMNYVKLFEQNTGYTRGRGRGRGLGRGRARRGSS